MSSEIFKMSSTCRRYIFVFAQEHVNFRKSEIASICQMFNINITSIPKQHESFWLVDLENDSQAKLIASRSMTIFCILRHVYSQHYTKSLQTSLADFHKGFNEYVTTEPEEFINKNATFRITVETRNKKISLKQKVQKIEQMNYLPIKGSIDLKNPDINWFYIEDYPLTHTSLSAEFPSDILFGKWIADGQRSIIKNVSLKNRKFIANTSMDPQIAFLMGNQGLCQSGHLCYDPFVGSGSILVSAAKFGAYVIGSDIDYLMVHGKTKPSRIAQTVRGENECIKENLKQINCESLYLDVLVSDFSKCIWSENIKFDSIITDPPYGIREKQIKIEAKLGKKLTVLAENSLHFPSTTEYKSIYVDLLTFSAKYLVLGGRLVCFFPIHKDDYSENLLPNHTCLKLIANSEQMLKGQTTRRLLTYEKISNDWKNGSSSDPCSRFDFRKSYFTNNEGTREERKLKRAELKELGKKEALKRGKTLDNDGNVKKKF